jgi:hypothetical protein
MTLIAFQAASIAVGLHLFYSLMARRVAAQVRQSLRTPGASPLDRGLSASFQRTGLDLVLLLRDPSLLIYSI